MAGDDTSADLEVVGEVLDADLFESLEEVRAVSERWLLTYNHERPHDSLGAVPPLTFLPRPSSPGPSPYRLSTRRGSLRTHLWGGRRFHEGRRIATTSLTVGGSYWRTQSRKTPWKEAHRSRTVSRSTCPCRNSSSSSCTRSNARTMRQSPARSSSDLQGEAGFSAGRLTTAGWPGSRGTACRYLASCGRGRRIGGRLPS